MLESASVSAPNQVAISRATLQSKQANVQAMKAQLDRAQLDLIGYFLEHITTEVRRFAANRIRAVAYTGDNSVERVADKFVDVSGGTGKFAVGCSAETVEALLQVDHQILDCRDLFGG